MAELNMVSQQLKDLQYFNHLNAPGPLKLESNFNFNVEYAPDNSRCRATLYHCVKDRTDGPEHKFFISVELVGFFSVSGVPTNEDKKEFHVRCYEQLFPSADLLVRQVCAMGGMPNFGLTRQKISKDNVLVSRPQQPQAQTQTPPIEQQPDQPL